MDILLTCHCPRCGFSTDMGVLERRERKVTSVYLEDFEELEGTCSYCGCKFEIGGTHKIEK